MEDNSKPGNLRRTQRIALTPKADLSDGVTSYKALIQDMSDEGLLLVCTRAFKPNQKLRLQFQLSTGAIIECGVEVRHSSELATGVQIIAISTTHRTAYQEFLQEFFIKRIGRKAQARRLDGS